MARYYSIAEVCRILRIKPEELKHYVESNVIRLVRKGGKQKISEEDVTKLQSEMESSVEETAIYEEIDELEAADGEDFDHFTEDLTASNEQDEDELAEDVEVADQEQDEFIQELGTEDEVQETDEENDSALFLTDGLDGHEGLPEAHLRTEDMTEELASRDDLTEEMPAGNEVGSLPEQAQDVGVPQNVIAEDEMLEDMQEYADSEALAMNAEEDFEDSEQVLNNVATVDEYGMEEGEEFEELGEEGATEIVDEEDFEEIRDEEDFAEGFDVVGTTDLEAGLENIAEEYEDDLEELPPEEFDSSGLEADEYQDPEIADNPLAEEESYLEGVNTLWAYKRFSHHYRYEARNFILVLAIFLLFNWWSLPNYYSLIKSGLGPTVAVLLGLLAVSVNLYFFWTLRMQERSLQDYLSTLRDFEYTVFQKNFPSFSDVRLVSHVFQLSWIAIGHSVIWLIAAIGLPWNLL